MNSIIVHKFDFSDEDVMGYYILFLKTLSLKLNTHTIHFFYNEVSGLSENCLNRKQETVDVKQSIHVIGSTQNTNILSKLRLSV